MELVACNAGWIDQIIFKNLTSFGNYCILNFFNDNLFTNCLSVFDHSVGLAGKGLRNFFV